MYHYYQKNQADDGEYVDANGKRYELLAVRNARPLDEWTYFATLQACLAAWGLMHEPRP